MSSFRFPELWVLALTQSSNSLRLGRRVPVGGQDHKPRIEGRAAARPRHRCRSRPRQANAGRLIQTRLNVSLLGIEHKLAQKVVDAVHLQSLFQSLARQHQGGDKRPNGVCRPSGVPAALIHAKVSIHTIVQ